MTHNIVMKNEFEYANVAQIGEKKKKNRKDKFFIKDFSFQKTQISELNQTSLVQKFDLE